ncbi:MAG: hypothetical protein LBV28_02800 [Puniceicoccales bacterium]|jgi:hypothetical protein|nr:hypothetical protein [Puniceicoccales bacterium]
MQDNFTDIENALRRLTPRAPSEFCTARIAAALDVPAATARGTRILMWSAGFAAACAAIVAINSAAFKNGADAIPPAPLTAAAPAIVVAPPVAAVVPPATAPTFAATAPMDNPPADNIAPAARRVLSTIEPLDLRRTPDGRFFQPYRLRYINTVKHDGPALNTAAPVRNIPDEEVHYVGLDLI